MSKKQDLPAMPFYFGDWRKAPEIRALDLDVRMIWFEMLGFMWESTERGYLTLNGKAIDNFVITKMIGVDILLLEQAIQQLEKYNVFSRRETDGAIYCRKMVRDEEIRKARSQAGMQGMSKRYGKKKPSVCYNKNVKPVITKGVTNSEDENEYENENVIKTKKKKEIKKETKTAYRPAVLLTEDEYKKLQTKCGLKLDDVLDKLENHKQAKGTKYKSDYHAILNWVIDAVEQEYIKNPSKIPQPPRTKSFNELMTERIERDKQGRNL